MRTGSKLAAFKSHCQIEHPLEIEDLLEYGVKLYRPDLPRLELVTVLASHPAKRYLEHRSHDAGIHRLIIEPTQVVLTLNDYDGWRLAGAYEQRLGMFRSLSMRKPSIPVKLSFSGIREFRVFQYEASGKLIGLKHSLKSNLVKMDSFVTDAVLQFDEEAVTLIIEARVDPSRCSLVSPAYDGRPRGTGSVWHAHNILLCIDCKDIIVNEGQRASWASYFGEDKVWIWDSYIKVRDQRSMPGWQDFVDFLEEIGA